MPELLQKLVIWVPISAVTWVLVGAALGATKIGAWPWTLNLIAGVLFGLTAATLQVAVGDGGWISYLPGVVAALVATTAAPRIWACLNPAARLPGHHTSDGDN